MPFINRPRHETAAQQHPLEDSFVRFGDEVSRFLSDIKLRMKDLDQLPEPKLPKRRPPVNPLGGM